MKSQCLSLSVEDFTNHLDDYVGQIISFDSKIISLDKNLQNFVGIKICENGFEFNYSQPGIINNFVQVGKTDKFMFVDVFSTSDDNLNCAVYSLKENALCGFSVRWLKAQTEITNSYGGGRTIAKVIIHTKENNHE